MSVVTRSRSSSESSLSCSAGTRLFDRGLTHGVQYVHINHGQETPCDTSLILGE
jgi:hypothetical protein